MISIEQGIVYSILLGVLIGIIWGAKKIVILEKIILNVDKNMQKMLKHIEEEEYKIEKKLSK